VKKKIVLGVDGSPLAEKALERVVSEAGCFDLEVVCVSVVEVVTGFPLRAQFGAAWERLMDEPKSVLDKAVAQLKEVGVEARGVIEAGRPADVIAKIAEKEGADEVIVGSMGKQGMDRLILGSVSARLIAVAKCTVVVVR